MTRDAADLPVVVVGAGPTGTTVASLLASYGVRTLLLDRWPDVLAQPRAVHLDDEVYRVLGRLGLAERFAAISRPALGLRLVDRRGAVLAQFDRDGLAGVHGFPQANMFDQPALEALLREHLRGLPSVTLRGGCEVVAVEQADDHVRVTCLDRGTGETSVVAGSWVLGCDGANSTVRSAIGARMLDLGFEQRWLVVDVDTTLDLQAWEGVHQLCDPVRAGTFMRVGATRYRWEFRLLDGEDVTPYTRWEGLAPLLAPWLPASAGPDVELVRVADYTFRGQVADRWREGRVLLLGDAAHLTPPFIGQGLGAGLRDATNLAWKLAGVLCGGLPSEVIDTYEAEREPHARELVRRAIAVGVVMTSGGRPGELLRRTVLPWCARVPGLTARVVESASPRLHVAGRRGRGRRLVGTLCPNALLDGGTRFDQAVGGRFAVVTATPLSPTQRRRLDDRGAVAVVTRPGDALAAWLRRGRAHTAVVRPDGTVAATPRSLDEACRAVPDLRPAAAVTPLARS